jgi:anaerobic nitric oxide reductase transcription regulator
MHGVDVTDNVLLKTWLPLVDDLSRDVPEQDRYRRLLKAVRSSFPCDATALLRLDGEVLVPLAVDGLSEDTLGRRFRVSAHPRFEALLSRPEPTFFPPDCELPDPYDGLVITNDRALDVHDCMGCPLMIDGRPWGLLTLDSLEASRFERVDSKSLQMFASLAAATVGAAERMRALARSAEEERSRAEGFRLASDGHAARTLVGRSAPFKQMLAELQVVGASDLTVLIRGETGVGKELVAKAIHACSRRADKPFVVINCAALPENLAESELFGHVRGAFSGATADRRGRFEVADHGTLFLDEVGELSLPLQAKLLRVMQSGQLQRVGSDREHHVDVRVIAATNRDLVEEVRGGRCHADFYHRLSVYPLHVPPLRERGSDVLLLSGYFLEENRVRLGLTGLRLAADAQAALLHHRWPGNVRELEHLIGRSALKTLARMPKRPRILTLRADDLDLPTFSADPGQSTPAKDQSPDRTPTAVPIRTALDSYERALITQSLTRANGNWAAAARELGIDRANLARSARRLGLK